jgi:hypothetical protein
MPIKLLLVLILALPLAAQEPPTSEQLRLPDDVAQYRAQLAAKDTQLREQTTKAIETLKQAHARLQENETTISYWKVQFQQAVTKANALQFELERIWVCVNKDGVPGYDPKTGDPTCTSRPKPDKEPAKP